MPVPIKPMHRATLLNISSGIALLAAASWFSYSVFAAREADVAPRVMKNIRIEPTILLVGKPFKVYASVYLTKLCPYETHWSLVRKPDNVEAVRIVEPQKPASEKLGDNDYEVTRYVPAGTLPGEYQYMSDTLDVCADRSYLSARRGVDITIR